MIADHWIERHSTVLRPLLFANTGSAVMPDFSGWRSQFLAVSETQVPPNCSEGKLRMSASPPRGLSERTVSAMQVQSADRSFAMEAQHSRIRLVGQRPVDAHYG